MKYHFTACYFIMSDSELLIIQASSDGDVDTVNTLVSSVDVNQLVWILYLCYFKSNLFVGF